MTGIHCIPPSSILAWWPHVKNLIAEACEYNGGRYASEDYLKAFLAEEKQLWLVMTGETLRAVVVTEILEFPQKRVANFDMGTGEGIDEWIGLTSVIEAWAKNNGCQQMLLPSRLGMERKLRGQNYRKTHNILEKDL